MAKQKDNPFRAGAGHSPPHLAGRQEEKLTFSKLLDQDVVTQNLVLTGLRGVGKTVLMENVHKPLALKKNWIWVGSDLSESSFVDERALCTRLLTDLSMFTSDLTLSTSEKGVGYRSQTTHKEPLTYHFLQQFFERQPGLMSDKLKATLEFVWRAISAAGKRGVVFAYDEAQVVRDRKDKDQYPLALLLEVFQSLQRKGMRFLLLLTGLPTLFQKLVESRTYAERMFGVQEISRLDPQAGADAITKPLDDNVISFPDETVKFILKESKCYPYFIQFFCKEAYDYYKTWSDQAHPAGDQRPLQMDALVRKLDADFFSGRWHRATDRQRDLLCSIASLPHADGEFTIAEIVEASAQVAKQKIAKSRGFKPLKTGDVGQALPKLIEAGLVYKNRYGKYSLAVPLFDGFIRRQFHERPRQPDLFDEDAP